MSQCACYMALLLVQVFEGGKEAGWAQSMMLSSFVVWQLLSKLFFQVSYLLADYDLSSDQFLSDAQF